MLEENPQYIDGKAKQVSENAEPHRGRLLFAINAARPGTSSDRWTQLAATAILILGSPRSGTTWLAKIFDSHPDILYRHEPDEACHANLSLDPATQIAVWLRQRGLRAAAKRPHFAKAWRPPVVAGVRNLLAGGLAGAQLVSGIRPLAQRIPLPDLVVPGRLDSVRAVVKLVNWDGISAARAIPGVRCVFILRHPCGQIASVMAGQAEKLFVNWATQDVIASARERAAQSGISPSVFAGLRDAAKLAWIWVAFNEPAVEGLRRTPNARIVRYEDLCRQPERTARALFSFANLPWHLQTARFLEESTRHDLGTGYFGVYRAGAAVADKWRQTMSAEDQNAVRSVVATSALARCWDDIL